MAKFDTRKEVWKGFGQAMIGIVGGYASLKALMNGVGRMQEANTLEHIVNNGAARFDIAGEEHVLIDVGKVEDGSKVYYQVRPKKEEENNEE